MGKTKKANQFVAICLYGFRNLSSEEKCSEFFEMLQDINPILVPCKISEYEPIRTPYALENAKDIWKKSNNNWGGGVIFQGRNVNEYFGSVGWKRDDSNIISLDISVNLIGSKVKVQEIIALAKKLFQWGNCVYGYGVNSSQIGVHYTPGMTFRVCLGGISWMSLFGPPYIAMFGQETLKSAPCYKEEFSDNCFMLLTSDEPQEPTPEILEVQKKVKTHLGEDAFFRGITQWSFTPEEVAAGKDKISTEGYRAPDFSAYAKSVEPLNFERLIMEIHDNGTTVVRTE